MIAIFEGPDVFRLVGNRHYQVMQPGRVSSFISHPWRVPSMVRALSTEKNPCQFFERGTFELPDANGCPDDVFPAIRPEILAGLVTTQEGVLL